MANLKKISKILVLAALGAALSLALTGCGSGKSSENTSGESDASKPIKLVVGATPVPHAELLEFVKGDLASKGIDLEIKEFTDYVTPNTALNDGKIDVNFFQHQPYLDEFSQKNDVKLVTVGKTHVEPIAAYSEKLKSKSEIKDGATVAIPNDATNEGRALLLLQKEGFIKLKDEASLTATPKDIAENPKNLKFSELDAAQLPRTLQDVDFAVINTNFALEAKIDPLKNLFMEGKDSPYANILVAREDNKSSRAVQELVKSLNSEKVREFIKEKYKGAIIPAF